MDKKIADINAEILEVENQIKEREILAKAYDVKNAEYRVAEDKYKEEEKQFFLFFHSYFSPLDIIEITRYYKIKTQTFW